MKSFTLALAITGLGLVGSSARAQGLGFSYVSPRFALGVGSGGGYYPGGYYGGYPAPVVVAPAPVIVAQPYLVPRPYYGGYGGGGYGGYGGYGGGGYGGHGGYGGYRGGYYGGHHHSPYYRH